MEPEEGMLAEAGGNSVPSQGNCAGSEGESQNPTKRGKLAEGKLEQKRSPRKKRKNIPTLTTTVRRRTSLKKARRKSSWTAEASNGMRRKTRREILSESRQRIVGGARDGSLPAARAAAGSLHKAGRAAAGRLQTASNGNGDSWGWTEWQEWHASPWRTDPDPTWGDWSWRGQFQSEQDRYQNKFVKSEKDDDDRVSSDEESSSWNKKLSRGYLSQCRRLERRKLAREGKEIPVHLQARETGWSVGTNEKRTAPAKPAEQSARRLRKVQVEVRKDKAVGVYSGKEK